MNFNRLCAGIAMAAATGLAAAQGFPGAKPIRLIVGYPPGGGIDFAARTVQVPLQEALKQQLVVDYKPGASGMIAATELTRQPADGYTLLLANTGPFAIAPYLQSKPPYDPIKQFTYIGQISQGSYIAVTRPDHPAKNLKEFVAWAKGQPGKVNFASGGAGSSTHVSGELFKLMTGVNMVHIPYRGTAPAVTDLIAGQVQVMFDNLPGSIAYARSGMTRALAVTTTARSEALPDVPTVADSVPGYEVSAWFGLAAPKNTPNEIIVRLNEEINAAFANAKMKGRLTDLGAMALAGSPADFGKLISDETEKWSKVIRATNIKLE